MKAVAPDAHRSDNFLAWYFVSVWGSGYLATKIGLQYAAPFTFLTLRFVFGIACLVPLRAVSRRAGRRRARWFHICVAGLLMHAINLGGSHYTQYLGISAGIAALMLSVQPLLTALIASGWMGERLGPRQWAGIAVGLAGVVLVVWHKIDVARKALGSLIAVGVSLSAHRRHALPAQFCPLRSAQRRAGAIRRPLAFMAPLAWTSRASPCIGRGRCSRRSVSSSSSPRSSPSTRCIR